MNANASELPKSLATKRYPGMSDSTASSTSDESAVPEVAVIMRSKNEQPYAEHALRALSNQTYSRFTLYNVDSGSTDGTLELVRRHNLAPDRIFQIPPEDYVPGVVLNSMVEKTTEPVIVFLNADAIPLDETWLERLIAPILNGRADATMSRQVARKTAAFINQYDYERAYSSRNVTRNHEFFSAAACAFRRELWEETKFYTDGYAEDLAWSCACQAKGARFELVHDSAVEHSHDFTLSQLYRKRYRHGIAFVYIYGTRPSVIRQSLACAKEIVRDFLYAVRKLRIDTIPYNIVYRLVIHVAYYRGEREGQRRNRREKQEVSH
jgi:rhamnosyltransferase